MLGAVKKTFIGVKEYKSRIYDIKQLKSLHGTGPFVCKVRSSFVPVVYTVKVIWPNLHLPPVSPFISCEHTPHMHIVLCATTALSLAFTTHGLLHDVLTTLPK